MSYWTCVCLRLGPCVSVGVGMCVRVCVSMCLCVRAVCVRVCVCVGMPMCVRMHELPRGPLSCPPLWSGGAGWDEGGAEL